MAYIFCLNISCLGFNTRNWVIVVQFQRNKNHEANQVSRDIACKLLIDETGVLLVRSGCTPKEFINNVKIHSYKQNSTILNRFEIFISWIFYSSGVLLVRSSCTPKEFIDNVMIHSYKQNSTLLNRFVIFLYRTWIFDYFFIISIYVYNY